MSESAETTDREVKSLHAWRLIRELSIRELAEASGVSVQTIWSIENGQRKRLHFRTRRQLAKALTIETSQIAFIAEDTSGQ